MTERLVYLDASAIVKLIVSETESAALTAFITTGALAVTSRVGAVEVRRAAARRRNIDELRLEAVLARLAYRELDDEVAYRAGSLPPTELRTLDAIHLASAVSLRPELDAFLTYDSRLAEAARLHGLPVGSPA